MPQSTWIELSVPRAVRPDELASLSVLARALGDANASLQAERAQVVARCACGCPSVRLRSDAPPLASLPATLVRQLGRDDYVGVSAHGVNATGIDVTVVAHFLRGHLVEFEAFAGEGVTAELPDASSLCGTRLD